MIAQMFQSVHYPILPNIDYQQTKDINGKIYCKQTLRIRHHSLFVPRDFDVSPYFEIVKPMIERGFDLKDLKWDA